MIFMNLVVGGGLSGLSFSHFFNEDCTIIDLGIPRIKSLSQNPCLDLGAQFFSKQDYNFFYLLKSLKLQSQIKKTNFNKFYIEKNETLINIHSKSFGGLSKAEQKEFKLFKQMLNNCEDFLFKNSQELQNTTFSQWYQKLYGGESLWICDAFLRSITFSTSKELNALYGIIACQSFFLKTYTFPKGMEYVITQLSKHKKIIRSQIEHIEFNRNKVETVQYNNKVLPCRKLTSAIPSSALSKIVSDHELSKHLSKVPYGGCEVIVIKTKNELTKGKPGIITPERKTISAIIKNRDYYTILAPYMKVPPAESMVLEELGVLPEKTVTSLHWDYSLPTCTKKLHLLQQEITEITNQYDNFAICGDFMGLPSLDACVESAKKAAEKLNKN